MAATAESLGERLKEVLYRSEAQIDFNPEAWLRQFHALVSDVGDWVEEHPAPVEAPPPMPGVMGQLTPAQIDQLRAALGGPPAGATMPGGPVPPEAVFAPPSPPPALPPAPVEPPVPPQPAPTPSVPPSGVSPDLAQTIAAAVVAALQQQASSSSPPAPGPPPSLPPTATADELAASIPPSPAELAARDAGTGWPARDEAPPLV